MTLADHFSENLAGISPSLRPVGRILEKARSILVDAYMTAETDIATIDCTVADNIYPDFKTLYGDMAREIAGRGITLKPLNATFIKPQAGLAPPLASLSLDSCTAQLGK